MTRSVTSILLLCVAAITSSAVMSHEIPFEHTHNDKDGTYTVTENGKVVSDTDPTAKLWNPRGKTPEQMEARIQFLIKSFDPPRSVEEVDKDNTFRKKFKGAVVINSLMPASAKLVGIKDEHFISALQRNDKAGITLTSATVMAFPGSSDAKDPREPAAASDKILKELGYKKIQTTKQVRAAAKKGEMVLIYNSQDSSQLTGIPNTKIDKTDPLANISTEEKKVALVALEDGMNWAEKSDLKTMNFAYNETNSLGGGGNQPTIGVTELGKEFMRMANERGIVVDCSHSSDQTCVEAAALSTKPMMASHSNVRGILDANRNMSDEAVLAVGKTGGVVCTNGVGIFVSENGKAGPELFVGHVIYTANLIGKEATCFSSDYLHNWEDFARRNVPDVKVYAPENGWAAPTENTTVEQIWAVARILQEDHGWNDKEIRGFLGENLMRVYEENWK